MNARAQTVNVEDPVRRAGPAATLACVLAAWWLIPGIGAAQDVSGQSLEQYETERLAEIEPLSAPQLDQLLAPIALYPDVLLSQILMASTYPLEVIEAYRWVSDPNNAALSGPALEAALEEQDWDPSVKSLVPFPAVLETMNDKLGWMQQLGDAFLAQEADVMDAVQRLREQAARAGNLRSNDQQTVTTDQQTIIIQPARTELVYVPIYDPIVVYDPWLWPAYPPYYFGPFPGYGIRTGIFTWFSFGTVSLFWGWSSWDWHHHHIRIDRHRYDRLVLARHRKYYGRDTWVHDPYHRRGVAYSNPRLRARFRPNPPGSAAARIDYRGYRPPATPTAPRARPSSSPVPARTQPVQGRQQRERERTQTVKRPARVAPAQLPAAVAQPRPRTGQTTVTARTGQQPAAVPPAFEHYTHGAAARAAAERARISRRSPVARVPVQRQQLPRGDRAKSGRQRRK